MTGRAGLHTSALTVLRAGRWVLDPERSTATFVARAIFGVPVRGWVPITSASVDVDESGSPRSVRAQLDLASIDTGNPRRDRDLRKPKLLDLDQHPRLTFGAGAPVPVDGGWTATGVLDRRPLGMCVPRFVIGLRVRFDVVARFVAPA